MWIEDVLRRFRRAHRAWRLYHGTDAMECLLTSRDGASVEIRFNYRGEEYHRFLHATRGDAEREAHEKRQQLLLVGWSESPTSTSPCAR